MTGKRAPKEQPRPLPEDMIRFLKKIELNGRGFKGDPCWNWTGAVQANGYGRFSLRAFCRWKVEACNGFVPEFRGTPILIGKEAIKTAIRFAHRVSYAFFNGPIPKGLMVDHLCHNTRCVNPAHLRLLTNEANVTECNVRRGGRYQEEEVPF